MTSSPEQPDEDADRQTVRLLAMYGLPAAMIARHINCSEEELLRRFAEDIADGDALGLSRVAERMHNVMVGCDPIRDPRTRKLLRRGRPPNKRLVLWYFKQLWGATASEEAASDSVIRLRFATAGPLADIASERLVLGSGRIVYDSDRAGRKRR